jgi:cytochrome c-type biogenesis protein CcmH/NrfG
MITIGKYTITNILLPGVMKMMRRLAASGIAILILCTLAFAQEEKPSPLSDYQYKKDYAQYENIKKEADIQKRESLLLAFLKERPVSRMLLYIVGEYLECVRPILEKKDWAKAIAMEEGLMALLPTEKIIQESGISPAATGPASAEDFRKNQLQASHALIERSLFTAYYQSNNMNKSAEIGERLYASAHDRSLLPVLADIYLKMQNYDKFLDYGNKILAGSSIDREYIMAIQMAQIYAQKKQNASAAMDLYSKVVASFGDKIPPSITEAQYKAIRVMVYSANANAAFEKKDYPKAQELSEKVLQLDSQNNAANYFIAMALYEKKDYPKAQEFFEKVLQLDPKNNAAPYYIAMCLYEKKDYPKAQDYFEKVLRIDPKNDVAYYYIAMCKWNNKDSEGAIEPFAKCVVLNKATAKKAQEYLEQLYRNRNNKSLDGLEKVLAKAKSDLGIR